MCKYSFWLKYGYFTSFFIYLLFKKIKRKRELANTRGYSNDKKKVHMAIHTLNHFILHKNSFHGFLLKTEAFLLPQISFVIRTSILCLKLVHFIREHMQDSKLEQIPGGAAHLKTIHMYKKMANQVGYTEGGGVRIFP